LLKFHFFVTLLYYRIFIDTIIDIQIGRVIDLQRPNLPATCVNTDRSRSKCLSHYSY